LVVRRGGAALTTNTDAQGRYTLRNVPPGRQVVAAGMPVIGFGGVRMVTLSAGQELTSIDFALEANGTISGKVLDRNNEPIPDLEVVLVGREYFAGALHYYRRQVAGTDDRGEYRLQNVRPGISHLLLARQRNQSMNAVSGVPNDPKLRSQAPAPTYYPNSTRPEGGALVSVRSGEKREGVDFRVLRSPSYCIEGVLRAEGRPAELSFWIHEQEMSFGLGAGSVASGIPPGGKSGPDGKIRICGLHPGEYKFTAFSGDRNEPDFFGTTLFTITDSDVRNFSITPQPRLPLTGQVVWVGTPPDKPVVSQVGVLLTPLDRTVGDFTNFGRSSVPGEFSVKSGRGGDLLMDEYSVRIPTLPGGLYVKDITYGNTSVVRGPLRLGSAVTGAELRVIIGQDGGFLRVKVADKDGKAVPDANVILMPREAGSEADLAAMRIAGQTDQNGEYSSAALAPGRYYVLATSAAVTDGSPESLGKLLAARSKAKEVDVGAGVAVQLTLEPTTLN
jgi:protocatechuate 3,4-dioxygenase beta subunit